MSDEFNAAIDHFYAMDIADIQESDLRPLVHGCMLHGATTALREILPLYKGLKERILCIEGPVEERGWQTLVEAMDDPLIVEALALRNVQLDYSKGIWFFKALKLMPELHRLHLERVGVETTFLFSDFSRLECPPLELRIMTVSAGATADINVFPLVLKCLESCKLLNLSLVDEGEVTTVQHEMLGKALKDQVGLESLRLGCHVPKNFIGFYMPFLEMKSSLKVLELSHCDLGTRLCNELLKVLPDSKPHLWSLSLAYCNLRRCEGPDGRLQISHLARLPHLLELDLSYNPLEDDTIVPLLVTFEEKEVVSLERLNLNGTMMGDEAANALGSLLGKNRTLMSVGFASIGRRDDYFLKPLVLALQHNTSLLRLEVSAFAMGAWRNQMGERLALNRNAFKKAVAEGMGVWHGVSVLLGNRSYRDIVNRIIDTAEFSDRDALALSSLHPRAWAERRTVRRADGASK